jgi:hypothetical protein
MAPAIAAIKRTKIRMARPRTADLLRENLFQKSMF